jgi:hypothetical protein
MKLRVLKKGSKAVVNLGFCCSTPITFSSLAEGKETAYLKTPGKVPTKSSTSKKPSEPS